MLKSVVKRITPSPLIDRISAYRDFKSWPQTARSAHKLDCSGRDLNDPGAQATIDANIAWICRAQDYSLSQDGGVARHYSILKSWATSYPETTGYIVPTLLLEARIRDSNEIRERCTRMLNWLLTLQFPNGSFPGGIIGQVPSVGVTFNTGQILFGLVAGVEFLGHDGCRSALTRAADWLAQTQDEDGCWRKHQSPFVLPGEKTYDTHVSWALFEAERIVPNRGYGEAGLKQVRWALTQQHSNGWFKDCCMSHPLRPLTHAIGYALRGINEAYRFSGQKAFLRASIRAADSLLLNVDERGFLAGRFCGRWRPRGNWSCLTGSLQIASCFFQLYDFTKDTKYLSAAQKLNRYVRKTVRVEGDLNLVGGVRGSFPLSAEYGQFEYLNWAAKFCIDSQRMELDVTSHARTAA